MEYKYQQQLMSVVKDAIYHGLEYNQTLCVETENFDSILSEKKATFVTLTISGNLRGCIGTLKAYQPLVIDLANNAFSAAFKDPRFPPLQKDEFKIIEYHVSILTTPTPIQFIDEQDLQQKIRPNIDGLILSEGSKRSTFLPSVWEQLPNKPDFIKHLKLKAGLPENYWSDTIRVERYQVDKF